MSTERKNQGRKKIEMKKMTNDSNMLVTFSKRRNGLFKKASELSTLCGADVGLVLFSPGGKVYSFGHPNVDTVIDRYLSQLPPQNNGTVRFVEDQRNANVCELNSRLTQLNDALEIEKRRKDELSHMNNMNETQYLWDCPFDGMDFNQLGSLKNALENIKKRIPEHANRLVNQGAPTQNMSFYVGNGSFSNMVDHHQQPFHVGNGSFSNMVDHHQQPFQPNPRQGQMFSEQSFQPIPQQGQMFSEQPFQEPMLQRNLCDFNIMGGEGYGPPRFF